MRGAPGLAALVAGMLVLHGLGPGVRAQAPAPIAALPGAVPAQALGLAVAGGEDLDGDQVVDVVALAAADAAGTAGLTVSAWSGATGALLWEVPTGLGGSFLGDLELIGDLDQDLVPDLLLGQPTATVNGMTAAGLVRVLSGATGATIQDVGGTGPNASLGGSLSRLGDVDGDGVEDFVASQPGAPLGGPLSIGSMRVISGATRATLREVTAATVQLIVFGEAATAVGDQDGDGIADLACGAPGYVDGAGAIVGSVEVHSSVTGAFLRRWVGTEAGAGFGTAVRGAGDVDRDGVGDVAVGTDGATSVQGLTMAGRVDVFSGGTGAPIFSREGTVPNQRLGLRLAALGDVDGEGSADLAASGFDGATGAALRGRLHLLFGPRGTRSLVVPAEAQPGLERSFDGIGDLDGDGLGDLLVGRPGVDGDPAMPVPSAGRLDLLGGLAAPRCTYGTVLGGTADGPLDVLGVSAVPWLLPRSGGHWRRVTLGAPAGSLVVWVATPPGTAAPARYAVFAAVAGLPQAAPYALPLGLGELCFAPQLVLPSATPVSFTLADTFGIDPTALPSGPAWLGPPGLPVLTLTGLPRPLVVTLQALVEDASEPFTGLAISNAVEVTLP